MINNFIFIASDTCSDTLGELSGFDIVEYRLDDSIWPIYKNTRNKNIFKPGDNVVIYVAGNKQSSKSFVAHAKIDQVLEYNYRVHSFYYEPKHISPSKIILLRDISWFDRPIPIVSLIDVLSIIPANRIKWGCIMQGGCRRLRDSDYEIILKSETTQNF